MVMVEFIPQFVVDGGICPGICVGWMKQPLLVQDDWVRKYGLVGGESLAGLGSPATGELLGSESAVGTSPPFGLGGEGGAGEK